MGKLSVMEIYQLLPKTNCKKCGLPACMAFSVALLDREKELGGCLPLCEGDKYKKKTRRFGKIACAIGASRRNRIDYPSGKMFWLRQLRGCLSG